MDALDGTINPAILDVDIDTLGDIGQDQCLEECTVDAGFDLVTQVLEFDDSLFAASASVEGDQEGAQIHIQDSPINFDGSVDRDVSCEPCMSDGSPEIVR